MSKEVGECKPLPAGPWLTDLVDNCGVTLPGGIKPVEFDCFHELIAHEEFCRLGVPGYCDGLGAGFVIGIPPILQFGTPELSRRVAGPHITYVFSSTLLRLSPAAAATVVDWCIMSKQ